MSDPVGAAGGGDAAWDRYETDGDAAADGGVGLPDDVVDAMNERSGPEGGISITTFTDGDVEMRSPGGGAVRYDADADFAFHTGEGQYLMRSGDTGASVEQSADGQWAIGDADGNMIEGTGTVARTDDLARPDDPGTAVLGALGDDPAAAGADVDTPFTVTEYDNGDVGVGFDGKTMVIEGGSDFEYARSDGHSIAIDADSGDIELNDAEGNAFTRTGEGGTSYANADGSAGGSGPPESATFAANDTVASMLAVLERAGVLTPELAGAILGAAPPPPSPGLAVPGIANAFAQGAAEEPADDV